MMNGSGFNGYADFQGYNTGMGGMQPMQYTQMRPIQPLMTNPLTSEEEKLLITEQDTFDLKVQPKEIAEAVCTHKKDGKFQIIPKNDGTGACICKLCHAEFNPTIVTEEYTQQAVDTFLNVLQTCKMIGVDMNNDVVRQFFQIIPYVTRVTKLYAMLVRIFDKYHMQNPVAPQSGPNLFNMYNNLLNPSMPLGNPMMGQPQYMYGMDQMQQNMVGGSPLYQQPMPPMGQPMMNTPMYGGYPQQQNMVAPTTQQPMPPMGQPQMPNQQVQQQQTPPQNNTQQQNSAVQVKEQLQL